MKIFTCQNCANTLHFNNSVCLKCGFKVGFIADLAECRRSSRRADAFRAKAAPTGCSSPATMPKTPPATGWSTPRAASILPRLPPLQSHHSRPVCARQYGALAEDRAGQRHLFYSLTRFELPIPSRIDDPQHGLAFEFPADVVAPDGTIEPVMTGHANGLISSTSPKPTTPSEKRPDVDGRTLSHPHRPFPPRDRPLLLGSARQGRRPHQTVKALFGDPTEDYGDALSAPLCRRRACRLAENYVSAYASAHPWEDFAETWAHCFHMVGRPGNAMVYGISPEIEFRPRRPQTRSAFRPLQSTSIRPVTASGIPLTVAINALNRSLGQPDSTPSC